jgi:hypothetical protein
MKEYETINSLNVWNISDICEQTLQIKITFMEKLEQPEVRDSLQSFGAESFVFKFVIPKYKM